MKLALIGSQGLSSTRQPKNQTESRSWSAFPSHYHYPSPMSQKPQPFQAPLTAALHHAIDYLTPASSSSVAATADLATLRKKLSLPLDDSGRDATKIIDDLVKAVEHGIIDSAGPRFFGWVIGGSLPAALAADWLTSAWDQNASTSQRPQVSPSSPAVRWPT
jgi:hypothetical protein